MTKRYHHNCNLFVSGWTITTALVFSLCLFPVIIQAQQYDLLIKNGHLIDPKNQLDTIMDVALAKGKVAKIANDINTNESKRTIDATGLYVTPGLIDLHTHVYVGPKPNTFAGGFSSVSPDDFSFRSGVTTMVDAGTSGWRNFPDFKETVIDQSATRVLAFLNITGSGMVGSPQEEDENDMDVKLTAGMIAKYPDIIVGTKIGHYKGEYWAPFDKALEAGRLANVPLLLECHLPQLPLQEVLQKMRPGDIFTHAFGQVDDRISILDDQGKLQPYVLQAHAKGIRFDVGHGGGSFHYSQAIPASEQGFYPDSFGTDLHRFSMNAGMKNMLNIMSKYLNLDMHMNEVLLRATWNTAQSIKRPDLGHLSEGAVADLAILSIMKGSFGFVDAGGYKLAGSQKLEAEMTIRAGKIVWDLNGLAAQNIDN